MALLERSRTHLRALGIAVLLLLVGGLGWALLRPRTTPAQPGVVRVPESTGITVEVLNGSGRQGLARVVTRKLRDQGFDVMFFGTRDSIRTTEVVLRRGDSTAALKVARALGLEGIRVALDTLLRLDVTVLLGADYPAPEIR